MGFVVQTAALRSSATTLVQQSDSMTAKTGQELRASSETAHAHGAWQAAGALSACVSNWTNRLHQIAGDLDASVKNLQSNANGYEDVDAETTSAMRQIAANLGK
jgi:hypothetical protein